MRNNDVKTTKIGLRITQKQMDVLREVAPKNVSYLVRKLIQDHLLKIQSEGVSR